MEKFSQKIDELMADNQVIRHIVRDFDQAMNTKANKCALKLLEEEFMRKYIHLERW